MSDQECAIRPWVDHRDKLIGYLNRLDHDSDTYLRAWQAAAWAQREIDSVLGKMPGTKRPRDGGTSGAMTPRSDP